MIKEIKWAIKNKDGLRGLVKEIADVRKKTKKALKDDGKIDREERKDILREVIEVLEKVQELLWKSYPTKSGKGVIVG